MSYQLNLRRSRLESFVIQLTTPNIFNRDIYSSNPHFKIQTIKF